MTPSRLLPLLGFLVFLEGALCILPPEKLQELSDTGSQYIDSELENAINGVRQMKQLMDQTSDDHRRILSSLEETQRQKEEALLLAKDAEKQLNEKEVCNGTMLALWEECKPCLQQTCMRFYTRTCHSGAGLVGRQLGDFLNHSSPFSVWLNGERVDSLLEAGEEQGRRLDDLEERFSLVESGVDDLFQESSQAYHKLAPFFAAPFGGFWQGWAPLRGMRVPSRLARLARSVPPAAPAFPLLPAPLLRPHHDFRQLFQPLYDMTQRLVEGAQKAMERDGQWMGPSMAPYLGGFPPGTVSPGNDRMVCREIRRNSAGCLKMKERCEKCKAILEVDCSQTDPEQSQLRERFEDAVRVAERFTQRYEGLLKAFQEEMLNTTALLDRLNQQFGWVSRLANATRHQDKPLKVITVISKPAAAEGPSEPADTQVTLQMFDSEPWTVSVPGDVTLEDPRFMEVVAGEALRGFKGNEVE